MKLEQKNAVSMEMTSLERISSKALVTRSGQYDNVEDFLNRAKVKVAEVKHLKDMFPDIMPI